MGKTKFWLLLSLFILINISLLFSQSSEMRHLWLHHYNYAHTNEARNEFFKRADVMGINTIFMFVEDVFAQHPDYFQAILDSAKNRQMKFIIVNSWSLDYDDMTPEMDDVKDYLYRPMNLTDEQWNKAIATAGYNDRGFTTHYDKNNPNVRDFTIQEMLKYFEAYPKIDGIAWDVSRMHGLLGSFHESTIEYTHNNSEINMDIIRDEVYGKLPMPSFRSLNSVGMNATTCQVLARYEVDKYDNCLGITLQEHDNSGSVVCFNRNSAAFEIPLYSTAAKLAIQQTGYQSNKIYMKKESHWRERGGYEFAYSIDFTPVYVETINEVPAGAPYIIIDGKDIDVDKAKELINHANTGACIIIGEPPYYEISNNPVDEITQLMGFDRITYVSPYIEADSRRIPKYLYITDEGRQFGLPETDLNINKQIELATTWMDWSANEMLGGTIRQMKVELKRNFKDRKLNIGTTRYQSDPWYQQQDWATWIKNGYIDYNTLMLYYQSNDKFKRIVNISSQFFEDNTMFKNYCSPILGLWYNKDSKGIISEQAITALEEFNLKGFGLFEDPYFFDLFSYEDCKQIGDQLNTKNPKFYYPKERPILFPYQDSPSFEIDHDELNLGIVPVNNDSIGTTITLVNTGPTLLDIVNIQSNDSNFSIQTDDSFILDIGERREVKIVGFSKEPKKTNSNIIIKSNVSEKKIPLLAEFRQPEPQLKIVSTELEFNSTAINDTASLDIILKNEGLNPLIINRVHIDHNDTNLWFKFTPGQIGNSDSLIIHLFYSPLVNEKFERKMIINSNDASGDSTIINITGEGKIPPKLQIFTN